MALAIAAISFTSCKKNDTAITPFQDISGYYKMTALKLITAGNEVDYLPTLDACSLDDVLTFKSNKTYTYTDAGLACTPNGSESGTWNYKGRDSLVIDNVVMAIVSKTNTELVLLADGRSNSLGLVFKTTYKKQ